MSFFPDTDQLLSLPDEPKVFYGGAPPHQYSNNPYSTHAVKQSYGSSESDLLHWQGNNSLGLIHLSPAVLQPSPTFVHTPASMATQGSMYAFKQETWPDSPQLTLATHMPMWTPPQSGLIPQGPSPSVYPTSSTASSSSVFPTSSTASSSSVFPTSSTASSLASPFISNHHFAPHGSPAVKLEPYDHRQSPESQYSVYEDNKVINPNDLLSDPAPATPQMGYAATAMTTLSPRTPDQAQDLFGQPVSSVIETARRPRQKRALTDEHEVTVRCKICNTGFKRKSNLLSHMETHEENRKKPYSCGYADCDWQFRRRTDMIRHEKSIHLKSLDHRCECCDRAFGRKDTLDRHRDSGCTQSHVIPGRSKAKRQPPRSRSRYRQY